MKLDIDSSLLKSFSMVLTLPNNLELVGSVAQEMSDILRWMRFAEENQIDFVQLALIEMMTNAIEHGNLEISGMMKAHLLHEEEENFERLVRKRLKEDPYKNRKITVKCDLNQEEARYVISDEGPGFDPKKLEDFAMPELLTLPSGRGIMLTKKMYMDEVYFNEKGNQVTLVKKRKFQSL